ncbi:site-specific integrase [Vibrio coralliilyticus]|uniref:site-specific integrase n=1 Tax=Vibrio coralliilyticus TaxID=190893 RepID=UPI00148BB942|nr:site-specific integrase [Vibrio coralliilyticus]NOI30192.1 site-specific integrase [Vibrio coralliilyticus]NOI46834.1 site-specific integrase [Vibrio coralliilyticus]
MAKSLSFLEDNNSSNALNNTTRTASYSDVNPNLYIVRSSYGVYSFRWHVKESTSSYKQIKISLRTKNFLEATALAYELYVQLRDSNNPSEAYVRAVFQAFKDLFKQKNEEKHPLSSIDILSSLQDLAEKSKNEYTKTWNSFLIQFPDICIGEVTQAHIAQWINEQTGAAPTVKKKVRFLSSCFVRAEVPHEQSWFVYKVKKDEKNVRAKRAFTSKEVEMLFKHTDEFKSASYKEDAWKYYLPRMAALTGCRLNELAQMTVNDVHLKEEQPYISINRIGENKQLKNDASVRHIPISSSLRNLMEDLVAGRMATERLFPSLPYGIDNGYTSKPSKYFSKFCRETFKLKNVSFHSFRHYAITSLFNLEYSEELIASIMGHSVGKHTTGKAYMSGFTHNKKLEALEALDVHTRKACVL